MISIAEDLAIRAWIADDPDPATARELTELLTGGGTTGAAAELADRFTGLLSFGTAGLRGPMAAGPNRMNQAVVLRAAASLMYHLGPGPRVVIGYDARHRSHDFALTAASAIAGAGGIALLLPEPLPTPVLAFAVRHLRADAGLMITASHNRAADNGLKVYRADGRPLRSPIDRLIAQQMTKIHSAADIARLNHPQPLGPEVLAAYLGHVKPRPRPITLTVVHTPLHGVGGKVLKSALRIIGCSVVEVPEQSMPDPNFPTLPYPNPEEPGALDLAFGAARAAAADLVLATDPDADRLAVAVPDRDGWRILTGDEVGVLLGAQVLENLPDPSQAVFASSRSSSGQLAELCRQAGVRHVRTDTGFKSITAVPGLTFGYEEALGYCLHPALVADKDGITAAVAIVELAQKLADRGQSLPDRLDELARVTGVYATGQCSLWVDALLWPHVRSRARAVLAASASDQVQFRASGTEPKLKAYLQVIQPVRSTVDEARALAARKLTALRAQIDAQLQHIVAQAQPR